MKTKRKLNIEIECADNHCYYKFGKHCKYLMTKNFGTEWVCGIFNKELFDDRYSRLSRCEECKNMERK